MRPVSSTLRGSDGPLSTRYDVALLDLDGVVYVGPDAVPGAPQALRRAREEGMRLAFVTNNAARPPQAVAAHLTELGISAEATEVITSAQAAARYLSDRLPSGARVLVLGTDGLIEALRERGLTPVHDADGRVDAVVQGFSPTMDWALLSEGAVAINRRAPWVATNIDPTVPSPRGPLPGNGSLVKALQHATGADPVVTGKPDPTMHRETLLRTGAASPLVVGDRLDTDIEGANAVGCDSMIVFSGVTTVPELLRAVPQHRPTYVGSDLRDVLVVHPPVEVETTGASCGRWRATISTTGEPGRGASDKTEVVLETTGEHRTVENGAGLQTGTRSQDGATEPVYDEDQLDAIRALCAGIWSRHTAGGDQTRVRAGTSDDARSVLAALGLDTS
ncbi:HAD-IIA family hydrolase [uncultured Jatrophihabitans sp.]|uniref:HAD-IIA family hydrolase n=1 Tax=uncultured Jatrophihabitans sp. TaxID=1610747 RepID=UPI0035CC48F2